MLRSSVRDMLWREEDDAKQLIRAQRMAKRSRAFAACLPCKAKKAKCNDYRPCARCQRSPGEECIDDDPEITSAMYPANLYRASSSGLRDNSAAPEDQVFHGAVVSDSSRRGPSDAFSSFTTGRGYGPTSARAFMTAPISPVCV